MSNTKFLIYISCLQKILEIANLLHLICDITKNIVDLTSTHNEDINFKENHCGNLFNNQKIFHKMKNLLVMERRSGSNPADYQ